MIKIIKNLKIPIKNKKGMEIIQVAGLIIVSLVLATALMYAAANKLGSNLENVGKNIASIFGFATTSEDYDDSYDNISTVSLAEDTQRLGGMFSDFFGRSSDEIKIYSHSKSGTTHSLSGKGDNVRFTTTAGWNANDTLTINGKTARIYNYKAERLEGTNIFAENVVVNMSIEYIDSSDSYNCYLKPVLSVPQGSLAPGNRLTLTISEDAWTGTNNISSKIDGNGYLHLACASGSSNSSLKYNETIDMSLYNTCYVTVTATTNPSNGVEDDHIFVRFRIASNNTSLKVEYINQGAITYAVDISSITDICNFYVEGDYGNTVTISEIYFE